MQWVIGSISIERSSYTQEKDMENCSEGPSLLSAFIPLRKRTCKHTYVLKNNSHLKSVHVKYKYFNDLSFIPLHVQSNCKEKELQIKLKNVVHILNF